MSKFFTSPTFFTPLEELIHNTMTTNLTNQVVRYFEISWKKRDVSLNWINCSNSIFFMYSNQMLDLYQVNQIPPKHKIVLCFWRNICFDSNHGGRLGKFTHPRYLLKYWPKLHQTWHFCCKSDNDQKIYMKFKSFWWRHHILPMTSSKISVSEGQQ